MTKKGVRKMVKRTILPIIIGIIAACIFIASVFSLPAIISFVCSLPVIGAILQFFLFFSFYGLRISDLLYATAGTAIADGFIRLATRYDNHYPFLNSHKKASVVEGALLILFFVASMALIIYTNQFSLEMVGSILPYVIIAIYIIFKD